MASVVLSSHAEMVNSKEDDSLVTSNDWLCGLQSGRTSRKFHVQSFIRKMLVLGCFITTIGCIYILTTKFMTHIHTEGEFVEFPLEQHSQVQILSHPDLQAIKFRQQRNELSKQLNNVKKEYGQQNCEMLKMMQSTRQSVDWRISESGGWCLEASNDSYGEHIWDSGFSTALSVFLKGKKVASFGEGPGTYKKHLDTLGEVTSYTAYDGSPFCENVTNGLVQYLDLTSPQYGLPAYAWVVCVEVGEHIPAIYENIFLDNLVRHASFGIILSWAVPGQNGLSHVNNKDIADVVAQMARRGFHIDRLAGRPLREAAKYDWLKQNVHIYYRTDPTTFIPEDA